MCRGRWLRGVGWRREQRFELAAGQRNVRSAGSSYYEVHIISIGGPGPYRTRVIIDTIIQHRAARPPAARGPGPPRAAHPPRACDTIMHLVRLVLLQLVACAAAPGLPGALAGRHRPRRQHFAAPLASNATSLAVGECGGAVGDGAMDVGAAVQQCIRRTEAGGRLSFPAGLWLVSQTIFVNASAGLNFDLGGTGWSSNVLWDHDSHLFQWSGMAHQLTLHDLAITSVGQSKSAGSTAIRFTDGVQDSVISKVLIIGSGAAVAGKKTTPAGGGFDLGVETLTVDVTDCEVWTASGFGSD